MSTPTHIRYNCACRIVSLCGKNENIISVEHCATRLRIQVKHTGTIDYYELEKLSCVKGVIKRSNQVQLIIGSDVKELFTFVHSLCLK